MQRRREGFLVRTQNTSFQGSKETLQWLPWVCGGDWAAPQWLLCWAAWPRAALAHWHPYYCPNFPWWRGFLSPLLVHKVVKRYTHPWRGWCSWPGNACPMGNSDWPSQWHEVKRTIKAWGWGLCSSWWVRGTWSSLVILSSQNASLCFEGHLPPRRESSPENKTKKYRSAAGDWGSNSMSQVCPGPSIISHI